MKFLQHGSSYDVEFIAFCTWFCIRLFQVLWDHLAQLSHPAKRFRGFYFSVGSGEDNFS